MHSGAVICLLAFIKQAHATEVNDVQESVDNLINQFLENLVDRALETSPLDRTDLDDATLAKALPVASRTAVLPISHSSLPVFRSSLPIAHSLPISLDPESRAGTAAHTVESMSQRKNWQEEEEKRNKQREEKSYRVGLPAVSFQRRALAAAAAAAFMGATSAKAAPETSEDFTPKVLERITPGGTPPNKFVPGSDAIMNAVRRGEAEQMAASNYGGLEDAKQEYPIKAVSKICSGDACMGTVTLEQISADRTQIRYVLEGLKPGKHGFDIHEKANCAGPRIGDLGNVVANAQGIAKGVVADQDVSLVGTSSVIGRSFVVYTDEDLSARLACGEIKKT